MLCKLVLQELSRIDTTRARLPTHIDMPAGEERGRSPAVEFANANMNLWANGKPTRGPSPIRNPDGVVFPTKITGALTLEQKMAYQTLFRIEEITRLLESETLIPPQVKARSESPPPKYDNEGRRTNTREQLYRKKLEVEKYRLVEIALKMVPFYRTAEGYVKPSTFEEKYFIPVEQYPDVNFVGLLLGPRGKTLKQLQMDSKCKIAIRGRGSVKEGKSASDLPEGAMNMEEPLHCLIIADSEDKIHDGIKACQSVVIRAVTSPEGQNDMKRNQLRDLAELNGTLRENTNPCSICGLQGHLKYDCPNRTNYAQRIVCRRCNQSGHATRDCTVQIPHPINQQAYTVPGMEPTEASLTPPPPPLGIPLTTNNSSDRLYSNESTTSRYQNSGNNYRSRFNATGSSVGNSRYQANNFQNNQKNNYHGHGVRYNNFNDNNNNITNVHSNNAYNSMESGSSSATGRYQSRYQRASAGSNHSSEPTSKSQTPIAQAAATLAATQPDTTASSTAINSSNTTNDQFTPSSPLPPGMSPTTGPPGLDDALNMGPPGIPGIESNPLPPGLSNDDSGNSHQFPPGLSSGPPGL